LKGLQATERYKASSRREFRKQNQLPTGGDYRKGVIVEKARKSKARRKGKQSRGVENLEVVMNLRLRRKGLKGEETGLLDIL